MKKGSWADDSIVSTVLRDYYAGQTIEHAGIGVTPSDYSIKPKLTL
jgi:hypothetical protein